MPQNSAKILVVDDEKGMCESLRALLSKAGYKVKSEDRGEEALKTIEKNDFDLVITEITGLKMLRRLDEETNLPQFLPQAE